MTMRVLKRSLLTWRKQLADLNEVSMVQYIAAAPEVTCQIVILLKQVLNHLLLHILWQLGDVNLRSLDLHAHRILRIGSRIRGGGFGGVVCLGCGMLKPIVVALLDSWLLALVPYLACAEVPRLCPESH